MKKQRYYDVTYRVVNMLGEDETGPLETIRVDTHPEGIFGTCGRISELKTRFEKVWRTLNPSPAIDVQVTKIAEVRE